MDVDGVTWQKMWTQAYRVGLHVGMAPADAEDIAQETLVAVWQHGYDGSSAIVGTIVRNRAASLRRLSSFKRNVHEVEEGSFARVLDSGTDIENEVETRAMLALVRDLLGEKKYAFAVDYATSLRAPGVRKRTKSEKSTMSKLRRKLAPKFERVTA